MAQLSDDCFAFGGPMMPVDEAVALIAERVTPVLAVETIALANADGRVLAKDVSAPLPLPPFTNSAVYGYAVASRDLPQIRTYARRVRELVQEFANQAGDKLRVQYIDPEPFSEAEDQANRFGLQAVDAVTCTTSNTLAIPEE